MARLEKLASQNNTTSSQVASYLLKYQGDFSSLKISDIAFEIHSSTAACTRIAKDLGYSGFSELKYELVNLSKQVSAIQLVKNSSVENYISQIEKNLSYFIRNIDYDNIILAGFILKSSANVIVICEEDSLFHGYEFCKRLHSLNINTRHVYTENDIINQLGFLKNNDVIFCMKFDSAYEKYNNYINIINRSNHKTIVVSQYDFLIPKRGLYIKMGNFENLSKGIILARNLQIEALLDLIILETQRPVH